MPPTSPTVAHWELHVRLRQRRKQLGVDVATITEATGINRNNWSAIENGRRLPPENHLRDLAELFELDATTLNELLALRSCAKERGWWMDYSAYVAEDVLRLYGMEHGAQTVQTYQSLLMPWQLQSEEYARALITANIFVRQSEIRQAIEVRMRRQRRLVDDDPMRLTAVVSQAALLQQVGSAETQHNQLRHLATMIRDHPDTIDVRILPFTPSASGILGASSFHLLDFAGPHLPTLGWYESANLRGFIENADQIRDMDVIFTQAHAEALDGDESLAMIEHAARELK